MIINFLAKRCRFIAIVVVSIFLTQTMKAQLCTGCTTVISSNTSANITVGTGSVVCIAPGVTASGNITVNGGVLCNEGTVSNLTLIEGKFLNRGLFSKTSGALNITNAKNLKIICFPNSNFDVVNAMNMDALTTADSIVINVFQGAKFSIGQGMSISKGWLKITNAIPDPTSRTSLESMFNIGGQLNVSNSALKILNLPKGIFNVTNAITLDGKYDKKVTNYGVFNCDNAFNISGNGQGAYSTLINNNGTFNITGNLTSSYNNGTVTINNNDYAVKPQPTFIVKKSITFSKDNNIFNNYRPLDVTLDITMEKGILINNSIITARDVVIKSALLTNNNTIYSFRDFSASSAAAVVNNNGYIDVGRVFTNKGTFNLIENAFLNTKDYYNIVNGTINGPAKIISDEAYPIIYISGYSENSGYINGNVLVYDETLVGTVNNNGYGFDQVTNGSRISSNTLFAARSVGPSGPPAINCVALHLIFKVAVSGNPLVICFGGSSNLSSQFRKKVGPNYVNFPGTLYHQVPDMVHTQLLILQQVQWSRQAH